MRFIANHPKREGLVRRAKRIRSEIEQIFTDASHWNDCVRKPDEAPIDPDPDGELRRLADYLDRMIAGERAVLVAAPGLVVCRRCPAEIAFLLTAKGAQIPVDASSLSERDRADMAAGKQVRYRHGEHVSHFATCPEAAQFRRGGEATRRSGP